MLILPVKNPLSLMLDMVLPVKCRHCENPVGRGDPPFFCRVCWNTVIKLGPNVCYKCGRPFNSPEATSLTPRHRCGGCRKSPTFFDRARAVGLYEGVLAEAIHLFKFQGKTLLNRSFGRLAAYALSRIPEPDCLIPVPLHPSRLREREFNQALLLCDEFARVKGTPVIPQALKRVRYTCPQIGLKAGERRKNVRGAFSLSPSATIRKKTILLVDDVFTTGATVQECAKVLKQGGARAVYVLTLARATGTRGSG